MSTVAANRPLRSAAHSVQPTPAICIVDSQVEDYRQIVRAAAATGAAVHVVATAHEALRISRLHRITQWVINTELPGLSGYELCGMLKAQSNRTAVCLVANEYSVAAEQSAWQARASMFLCKGSHTAWLAELLSTDSPHAAAPVVAS